MKVKLFRAARSGAARGRGQVSVPPPSGLIDESVRRGGRLRDAVAPRLGALVGAHLARRACAGLPIAGSGHPHKRQQQRLDGNGVKVPARRLWSPSTAHPNPARPAAAGKGEASPRCGGGPRSNVSPGGREGCLCGDRGSPVRLQQPPSTGDSRVSPRCRVSRPPRSLAVLAAGTGAGAAMERGRPSGSPRSTEPAPSAAAAAAAARESSPGRTGAGQTGSGGVTARSGGGRPAAANAARERSRVQTLRHAFLELQRTLPSVPPDTKLSKLDVLLLATTYIAHLTRSLQDDTEAPGDPSLGALRGDGYLHPVKVQQNLFLVKMPEQMFSK
ncbi:transcription factor 24 [Cricetulus griseus]